MGSEALSFRDAALRQMKLLLSACICGLEAKAPPCNRVQNKSVLSHSSWIWVAFFYWRLAFFFKKPIEELFCQTEIVYLFVRTFQFSYTVPLKQVPLFWKVYLKYLFGESIDTDTHLPMAILSLDTFRLENEIFFQIWNKCAS